MNKLREIVTYDIFNQPHTRLGEPVGRCTHGFEKNGSWGSTGGEGWVPCVYVVIRWKGKRKRSLVMASNIISGVDLDTLPVIIRPSGHGGK